MWAWLLFNFVLFYALVPGVLVALPPGGSFQTQALTHAAVFAVVHKLLGGMLKKSMH